MKGTGSCNGLIRWPLTYPVKKISKSSVAGHIGQVPSLQFATTLHFLQVYVASGYSKSTTVDYLGVLGIGDHVWWLTFKRINLNAAVLVYNSDPHKGVVSLM